MLDCPNVSSRMVDELLITVIMCNNCIKTDTDYMCLYYMHMMAYIS